MADNLSWELREKLLDATITYLEEKVRVQAGAIESGRRTIQQLRNTIDRLEHTIVSQARQICALMGDGEFVAETTVEVEVDTNETE